MRIELNMDGNQYREILKMLNEGIYKYAEKQGIDINDTEQLIKYCNSMEKIKMPKKTLEILLDGIMHYDVGDQRVLKFIDLSDISFDGRCVRRVDFRGTNANVDPQTVEYKNIEGAIFEGIDMSDKCFDDCVICHTNLNYTNAKINPQRVYKKDFEQTKCEGLDFTGEDFTSAYVQFASFKNCKIDIDPQKLFGRCLEGTNLENVDMTGKCFDDCELRWCNLTNTNAVLDLRKLNIDKLYGLKLQGTTLLVGEDFDREKFEKQNNVLGKVKYDEYTTVKRSVRSFIKKINV